MMELQNMFDKNHQCVSFQKGDKKELFSSRDVHFLLT